MRTGRRRRVRPRRETRRARCAGRGADPAGPWGGRAGSASAAGPLSDAAEAGCPAPERNRLLRGPWAIASNRSMTWLEHQDALPCKSHEENGRSLQPAMPGGDRAVRFARCSHPWSPRWTLQATRPCSSLPAGPCARHARCTTAPHARRSPRRGRSRLLRALLGLRAFLRAPRRCAVTLEYVVGLAVAVLLGVYLVYALIVPERFQP